MDVMLHTPHGREARDDNADSNTTTSHPNVPIVHKASGLTETQHKIVVKFLPGHASRSELEGYLLSIIGGTDGLAKAIQFPNGPESYTHDQHCVIAFKQYEDASKAVEQLNATLFRGVELSARFCKPALSLANNRGSDSSSTTSLTSVTSTFSAISCDSGSMAEPFSIGSGRTGRSPTTTGLNSNNDSGVRWLIGIKPWDKSSNTRRLDALKYLSTITSKPPKLVHDLQHLFQALSLDGWKYIPSDPDASSPTEPGTQCLQDGQSDVAVFLQQVGSALTRTTTYPPAAPATGAAHIRGHAGPRAQTFPMPRQPFPFHGPTFPHRRHLGSVSDKGVVPTGVVPHWQTDSGQTTVAKRTAPRGETGVRRGGVTKRRTMGDTPLHKRRARAGAVRGLQDGADGDGDGDNGDHTPPRQNRREPADWDRHHPSRPFACPFAKRDPVRHTECLALNLRRIKDVKQHLYRKHQQPAVFCNRCWLVFKTQEALQAHLQPTAPAVLCDGQPAAMRHWMSTIQERRVKERSSQQQSHVEQWYAVFDILFDPSVPRPSSPYNVRQDAAGFMTWSTLHRWTILRSLGVQNNAPLEDLINRFLGELFRAWAQQLVPDPLGDEADGADGVDRADGADGADGSLETVLGDSDSGGGSGGSGSSGNIMLHYPIFPAQLPPALFEPQLANPAVGQQQSTGPPVYGHMPQVTDVYNQGSQYPENIDLDLDVDLDQDVDLGQINESAYYRPWLYRYE